MSEVLGKRTLKVPNGLMGFCLKDSTINLNDPRRGSQGGAVGRGERGSEVRLIGPSGQQAPGQSRTDKVGGKGKASAKTKSKIYCNSEIDTSDTESENEDIYMDLAREDLEQLDERLKAQENLIAEVGDNCARMCILILKALPKAMVRQIASMAESVGMDQGFLDYVIPKEENPSYAEKVSASMTICGNSMNGSSTTSQENLQIQTQDEIIMKKVNEKINERMEDLQRKKNVIIMGLTEDVDCMLLVEQMLREMGLGHLIQQIEFYPTRLGISRAGKFRPIKVGFRTEKAVEDILDRKMELIYSQNFY